MCTISDDYPVINHLSAHQLCIFPFLGDLALA